MTFTALTSLVLSQQHRLEEFHDGLPWLLVERVAELTRSFYGPRAIQPVLSDGRYQGDDHCTQTALTINVYHTDSNCSVVLLSYCTNLCSRSHLPLCGRSLFETCGTPLKRCLLIINVSISIESNDVHETVVDYSIRPLIRLHHNMYVLVGDYTMCAKYFSCTRVICVGPINPYLARSGAMEFHRWKEEGQNSKSRSK